MNTLQNLDTKELPSSDYVQPELEQIIDMLNYELNISIATVFETKERLQSLMRFNETPLNENQENLIVRTPETFVERLASIALDLKKINAMAQENLNHLTKII